MVHAKGGGEGEKQPQGSHTKRNNVQRCRYLRKNQTDAERKLWSMLRDRRLAGAKFRRQFSIGRYILDSYSPEHKLGIEADGGQHYQDKGRRKDQLRTRDLSRLGVKILRFNDRDILTNIQGLETIYLFSCISLNPKKTSLPHQVHCLTQMDWAG